MKTPLVSVIVTAYNNAEFLPKCLDSLTNQTLTDIEIICLNDASTDNTAEVLEEIASHDARIKIVNNPKNLGVSATRNHGISIAQAPYIMFCDGDDYYNLDACDAMYSAIKDHNVDLGISEINIIYQAHSEMKASDDNYYSLKYSGQQLLDENTIYYTDLAPTNKIFKKSLIEKYHIAFPEGHRFEDAYFCVAYMCAAKSAFYLNQQLYNYIRRENSLMSSTWSDKAQTDIAIDHLYIAFMLYDFLEQHELLSQYNQLYWRLFEAFEDFALRNSKSQSRVREVKTKANDFIQKHLTSFTSANINTQENIRRLNSGKFYISTIGIKRLLIKFLPTYRLATENIQRLRSLKVKNQQLIDKLYEISKE